LGNASIYALLGEIFELYKDHPTDPKRTISHTFADFGYKLFQEGFVQDQIPFEAFITPPNWYWLDIGTPRKLLQANFDIMSGRYKDGTLGHEIRPGIWLGRDVRISEATLAALKPPVVIGDSVIIDGNDSEIGPDVAIGPEWEIHGPVKIKSCVLLGPCYEDRLDHIKILRPGVSVEGSILAGGIIESADPIVNKVVVIDPSSQLRFSDLN
jgi:NDP-sugar pyrophosphorylase family protein